MFWLFLPPSSRDHANMSDRRSCLPLVPVPPHLREVCAILAAGLLRPRGDAREGIAPGVAEPGESSLHFTAHPSGHANPASRRAA